MPSKKPAVKSKQKPVATKQPVAKSKKPQLTKRKTARRSDPLEQIRRHEQASLDRDAARRYRYKDPEEVYSGAIPVDASGYLEIVNGESRVVSDLDRLIAKTPIPFELEYPFEHPFAGEIAAPVTLRRTIDAIRSGLRTMYEGTTERAIRGADNRMVTGPYGRSYHVIGDLVIESITLYAGKTFVIFIGS